MEIIMQWLFLAAGVIILSLIIKPLRPLLSGLLRTALAFFGIIAFNWAGSSLGIAFGLNLINSALIGFLGIPGLASAVALSFIF